MESDSDPGPRPASRKEPRLLRRWRPLVYLLIGLAITVVSITVGLLVTPSQKVSTAGQTIAVGATAPSFSLSGPGEVSLFGQELNTVVHFDGPVRPRLSLTHITLGRQLASVFSGGQRGLPERLVGQALASGWIHYFIWESLIVAGVALLLVGAVCGWWRLAWRRTLLFLVLGMVLVEAVNLGAVMVAVFTAPGRLQGVTSVEALVGQTTLQPIAETTAPVPPGVDAVVIGDSTAAGLGNAPLANPTRSDRACGRSANSYANALAVANGWKVLNLACSGATVPVGLLGPQVAGGVALPAQLSVAAKATSAKAIFVSVGADDLHWSAVLRLCAVTRTCTNRALVAYFQRQIALFVPHYYQLLQQLAGLPNHPRVLINLYYNPFDPKKDCLSHYGFTPAKERSLIVLLDALNGILAKGARLAGFTPVQPSFAGSALCDPEPYVQGLNDPAPFHPTAAGELVIALADQKALEAKK